MTTNEKVGAATHKQQRTLAIRFRRMGARGSTFLASDITRSRLQEDRFDVIKGEF